MLTCERAEIRTLNQWLKRKRRVRFFVLLWVQPVFIVFSVLFFLYFGGFLGSQLHLVQSVLPMLTWLAYFWHTWSDLTTSSKALAAMPLIDLIPHLSQPSGLDWVLARYILWIIQQMQRRRIHWDESVECYNTDIEHTKLIELLERDTWIQKMLLLHLIFYARPYWMNFVIYWSTIVFQS